MRLTEFLSPLVVACALAAQGPAGAGEGEKKPPMSKPAILEVEGELTAEDPVDAAQKAPSKVHTVKLSAGKTYRIDLRSADFDSFLRLEGADAKTLARDDDGGGFPNARIVYKAPADGEFKVVVTMFRPGKLGKYALAIAEADRKDLLRQRATSIGRAAAEEQRATIDELKEYLAEQKGKVGPADAQLLVQAAVGLEFGGNKELAARVYPEFGKALAASEDPKVAKMARTLEGAARRLRLPGGEIAVHGRTLEGEEFDWKAYRGKVVLVDFWATWCGPCIAELPNIRENYDAYHGKGFEVVAVSIDSTKEAPTKFVEKRKLPWVCLYDRDAGKGGPLAEHYGIFAIPQAILVDREGRVVSMNARGPELGRLLEKHLGPREKAEDKSQDK